MDDKINELRKTVMEQIQLAEKRLDEGIEKLRNETKQQTQGKWKPRNGERYFYANPATCDFCGYDHWTDKETDNRRYKMGVVYQAEEEATELGKRMYYRQWYHSLSDVTEEMWNNDTMNKYYAFYNWCGEDANHDTRQWCMAEATHFTSEEKLEAAIATIGGEEVFKRFVLGVE